MSCFELPSISSLSNPVPEGHDLSEMSIAPNRRWNLNHLPSGGIWRKLREMLAGLLRYVIHIPQLHLPRSHVAHLSYLPDARYKKGERLVESDQ